MRRALAMSSISALALLVFAAGCGSNNASNDGDGGFDGLGPGGTGGSGGGGGRGGGGGSAGTNAGSVNCGDPYAAIDPTAVIDDMEAPDYMTVRAGGRSGAWWAGGDAVSPGSGISPNGDASAELIAGGGRCGSKFAMHVTGHGYTMWAVLSVSMGWGSVDGGADDLLPNDNDFRTGVTFWARIGDTSSDRVRFAISDKYSRPQGGYCIDGGAMEVACYDTHGVYLTKLDTTWKQYRIPFAGLTQRGFGLPRNRVDPSSIYTIEFQFDPNTVFDFGLDDISFY